jgi:uncharacterized protein (UPF0335 family)
MAKSNSAIELPADHGDATRWIYARVKKLTGEKKWIADAIREKMQDAKKAGDSPAAVREAVRLERMTPEKRAEWEAKINVAAKLFGYSPLELVEMPDRDMPIGGTVRAVAHLEDERRQIGEAITETFAAGKEAGIDVKTLRLFLRMSGMAHEEVGEWFDAVDTMGKALGRWGANFDDLHETD